MKSRIASICFGIANGEIANLLFGANWVAAFLFIVLMASSYAIVSAALGELWKRDSLP